jgi:ankyrin repeat protein
MISTTNDCNQTLAHISIFCDYPTLLSRLVDWRIDLAVADVNGLTALHCAYMKGDSESVRILRRGGASETATDKLSRIPSSLQPEGFESDIDFDAEVAAGLDTDVLQDQEEDDIDVQLALGEQFGELDLDDDSDSGTTDSDWEDDASDDGDPDTMVVDSLASGVEGGGEGGASGSGGGQLASSSKEPAINILNQCLLKMDKRTKKKKIRKPRLLPDKPFDPVLSNVSKKLRNNEAEPRALKFLTRIFPSKRISLVELMEEMTPEEVDEFQLQAGAQKYNGLLRRGRHRNKEIVFCRLCPQYSQLDFKDAEEALQHITMDHFDMAYSCDCGW